MSIDTIDYVKDLEKATFTRVQAEASVKAIGKFMNQYATKAELKSEIGILRSEMKAEFKAVRTEMASEFKAVRAEMASEFKVVKAEFKLVRQEMKDISKNLIITLGGLMVTLFTIGISFVSFLAYMAGIFKGS